jgi:hypothetical protein
VTGPGKKKGKEKAGAGQFRIKQTIKEIKLP